MFSILEHIEKLTPDTGTQTNGNPSFLCPVCEAPNFKIDLKTGKYNAFSCDCTSTEQGKKAIIEKLSPTWKKPLPAKGRREWKYYDYDGNLLFTVIRTDDGEGNRKFTQTSNVKGKTVAQLRPEAAPYRWEQISEAIAQGKQIYWVEGESSADSLWQINLPGFTIVGGSNGDVEKYTGLIPPELLVICPDRDKPGIKYAEKIEQHHPGARWLYAFPDSWVWDRLPERDGADIKNWIEEGATVEEIEAAIENRREPKPEKTNDEEEDEEDVAPTFQEEALQDIFNHGSSWIAVDQDLYRFNGKYYEHQNTGEVRKLIRAWASRRKVFNPRSGKFQYSYMTPRAINQILEWAMLSFSVSPDRLNPPGLNLANGVLRITWKGRSPQWKLHPHSPEDYYLACSEVAYTPDADPKNCDQLLACLEETQRTALLRTIAAGLDFPNVRKLRSRGVRAVIARGSGNNGKDSIRQATYLLFGNTMTSADLVDFRAYDEGKKWYLAQLEGAKINWSSENNKGTSLDSIDSLNLAITGEPLKKEEKNRQPSLFVPQAVHIFNVNRLPNISSGLDSILSRFCVIDFNKTYRDDPDPQRGELKADPRFRESSEFLINEVCPAFLNRLLAELVNLAKEGIDYKSLAASLADIQEQSTHLWEFVKEENIVADAKGRIYVGDLWYCLENWYIDNETLEVGENGKRTWNDQPSRYDQNVTGPNQIYKRFKNLFPKIERKRETQDKDNKGRWFLSGIAFSASPDSLPDSVSDSASPPASPQLHPDSPLASPQSLPSPPSSEPVKQKDLFSEAKSEAHGEAETTAQIKSEAVKQNYQNSDQNNSQGKPMLKPGDRVIPNGNARWIRKGSQDLPKLPELSSFRGKGEISLSNLDGALFLDLTSLSRVIEVSPDGQRVKVMSSGGRKSVFYLEDLNLYA